MHSNILQMDIRSNFSIVRSSLSGYLLVRSTLRFFEFSTFCTCIYLVKMKRHELFPRLYISVFQMISLFHSSWIPNDSTLKDSRPRFPVPILFRCSVVDSDSVPVFFMYRFWVDSGIHGVDSNPVFGSDSDYWSIRHTVLRRMLITLFFIHRHSYRCWSMRPCWVIMFTWKCK